MAYLTFTQQRLGTEGRSMTVAFPALLLSSLHLSCVSLPATVHFAKAAPADDPVHTEVIHSQLVEDKRRERTLIKLNKSDFTSKPKLLWLETVKGIQNQIYLKHSQVSYFHCDTSGELRGARNRDVKQRP